MAIYGGIDLGGTKIQAAVVDEGKDHEVLGAKRDQTPLKGGPKAIAARMAGVLREVAGRGGLEAPPTWPASASARPAASTTPRAPSPAP